MFLYNERDKYIDDDDDDDGLKRRSLLFVLSELRTQNTQKDNTTTRHKKEGTTSKIYPGMMCTTYVRTCDVCYDQTLSPKIRVRKCW